ncbi:hypothetical protein [Burkholderia cenocepacia]|uniref:hypothetical protein n=1 Tax=Burkholderia cenocepacia TaxID=95486 RepID=UPI000AC50788|nr:hypothetical protein [Burkholderia cenocepacia]
MTDTSAKFSDGHKLRLVRAVTDDETGYRFPGGAPASFAEHLGETYCLVALEKSLGDDCDGGTALVMVRNDDIELA